MGCKWRKKNDKKEWRKWERERKAIKHDSHLWREMGLPLWRFLPTSLCSHFHIFLFLSRRLKSITRVFSVLFFCHFYVHFSSCFFFWISYELTSVGLINVILASIWKEHNVFIFAQQKKQKNTTFLSFWNLQF